MAKYRKKPAVIDAFQWNPCDTENFPGWLDEAFDNRLVWVNAPDPNLLMIKTLEGTMEAKPGSWIIKGVKGELYPCRPDIFQETYEPVE